MLNKMLVIVLIIDFYTLKLVCDPKNPSFSIYAHGPSVSFGTHFPCISDITLPFLMLSS